MTYRDRRRGRVSSSIQHGWVVLLVADGLVAGTLVLLRGDGLKVV